MAWLCLTLCDPIDCSMPGLPVPHCLPKFAQVHVLSFSDATQPILYLPMLYTVSIAYKCQSQSNSAHHHPLPPWRLYVCSQHLCLYFVLQIRPSIPFFFLGVMKMTWRKYTQIPVNSKPEGDTYNKNVPFKYFSSISPCLLLAVTLAVSLLVI